MVEPAGPFKIILSEPPVRAADDLGNPAAEQVTVELSRLLDLDEAMATSISGAMPIVILHGLTARQAGVARERLQVIVQLGCKVITTDEPSDTLPHVNWPVLPPIAQFDDPEETINDSAPSRSSEAAPSVHVVGSFTCPACQASFDLSSPNGNVSSSDAGRQPKSRARRSSKSSATLQAPVTDYGTETRSEVIEAPPEEEVEDDWMSPPVTRVPAPTPSPTSFGQEPPEPVPGGTARFNEAALLAYRQAEEPPPPPPPAEAPPPPPPQPMPMSFAESQFDINTSEIDTIPPPNDGSSFEATGSLHDSGSDILDLDPPHRSQPSASTLEPVPATANERFSSRASGDFEDDFDLLSDEDNRAPTLESLDELEESAPVHASASHSNPHEPDPFSDEADPFGDDDDLGRMLNSDEEAPRRKSKRKSKKPSPEGDLDAVLQLFGPEDEEPLDDMAGLQPAPLDLSAKVHRRNLMGSEFPSDILEPLNPSEAMEIIKSQKTRGGARETSDDFDLFGDSGPAQPAPSRSRKSKKKTRGVPFSASGEDLDLFEDNPRPTRSRSKNRSRGGGGGGGGGGGADPFARARQVIDEERSSPAPTKSKRREGGRSSSRRSRGRSRSPATGGGGGGGGGPAPKGAGDHGLVLSRISDPDKKERAAELIAEIKGCSLDDAARLTERTIIPVLKGVSRDVAEFHLDKFRRYKIAGRVTTRQRS
ncbi:MAG: hypothetical protein JKY65_30095 [Planctomycetes bacterium]|nr:hypothetical protein [Planctomycetota bacterium]